MNNAQDKGAKKMKKTITEAQFKDAFREIRPDNFSYAGLGALFEYFEEYEEGCDTEMELDVIAICCDFSEHGSAVECITDNGYDFDLEMDDDEKESAALEWLQEQTSVIEFDGSSYGGTSGVIICAF